MKNNITESVRRELAANADTQKRESSQYFFKEPVVTLGVKTGIVNRIAREHCKQMKDLPKAEVFLLCEELFRSNYLEESFIACEFAYARRKQYEPGDFATFEHWVETYVNNWATCDSLCNHTVGSFVEMYPEYLAGLKRWAAGPSRWMRRASAVSLIVPARHGKFLDDVFEIAGILMTDRDDLVQKGFGWMLKAASQAHRSEVFSYLMDHRDVMPRTAFRYALEKMPPDLRKQAMQK
jgi:3-methyladenine DNA glycosylase AlkD